MFKWFKEYRKQKLIKKYSNPTNIKNAVKAIFGLASNDTNTRREQYEDSKIKFEYQRNSDDSGFVKIFSINENDSWELVFHRVIDRYDHVTVEKFVVGNWISQLVDLKHNGIPKEELQEVKPKVFLPTREKLEEVE